MNFYNILIFVLSAQYRCETKKCLVYPAYQEVRKPGCNNLSCVPVFTPHLKVDKGPDPAEPTKCRLRFRQALIYRCGDFNQWEETGADGACGRASGRSLPNSGCSDIRVGHPWESSGLWTQRRLTGLEDEPADFEPGL